MKFDNQMDASIMRQDLLQHLEPAKIEERVFGLGGVQLSFKTTGFFWTYTSKVTKANVLCFIDIQDTYDVTYVPRESFTVHLLDLDISFSRNGKLCSRLCTTECGTYHKGQLQSRSRASQGCL
jgi:hypothetical protein